MTQREWTIVIIACVVVGVILVALPISWAINPNGFKKTCKAFWGSMWSDVKSFLFGHWLRLVGGLIAYVLPLAIFLAAYCTREPYSPAVSIPLAVWLVLIPLLLIYWVRIRRGIDQKLVLMKAVNEIDASKHYASIVGAQALKGLMGLATWFVFYEIVKMSEKVLSSASQGILILGVCYGVGAFLFVLDAVFTRAPKDVPIALDGSKRK
jgi:hypothetical protein